MEENETGKLSGHRLPARLAAQIIARMRHQGWPVGAHLGEQELATALRVSRTPVRIALRSLQDMGIVESRANRGFFLKEQAAAGPDEGAAPDGSHEDPLYFTIAEDRLNGGLERRCTEAELARRYDTPRARVVRLLSQLAQEGLVMRMPGHGWEFQPVLDSPEAYDQGYRYRLLIEPAALLEPGYALPAESLEGARERQRSMLAGGSQAWSWSETFAANADFHEVLVSGAANPFLLEGVRRVNRLRRLLEYRMPQFRDRMPAECRDHLRILDLVEAGKLPAAAEALQDHLERARAAKTRIMKKAKRPGKQA